MRGTSVLSFQQTAAASLRRPWQTFKDGQIWYGYTKSGSKRHPLTTKQGKHNFYKGTRSSGVGKLNNQGQYIVDWTKVRTYVVPSFGNLGLKPLVFERSPEITQKFEGYPQRFQDPQLAWDNIKTFIEKGVGYSEQDLEANEYVEVYSKNSKSKEVSSEEAS